MTKLLIVDDEPLIQVGIKSMLPWSTYGIEICGTASNGRQAFNLIETYSPEIVITDIKMPIMDGLELAKLCKEQFGTFPLFIILTSHEEIHLLKEAIKYDIIDYLVKLELTEETLLTSIQKALKIIEDNRHHLPSPPTNSQINAFYDKFFISLLHNLFESEAHFKETAKTLRLDFSAENYSVTYCSILSIDTGLDDSLLLNVYSSTLHMLQEILPKYLPCYISSLDMKYFSIIFCLSNAQAEGYKMQIKNTLESAFSMIHKYFNVVIHASIGRTVTSPLKIVESFQDARQIYPYLNDAIPLLFFEDHCIPRENFTSNTFNMELFKEDIKKAFVEYDAATLQNILSSIIHLFKNHSTRYLQAIDAASNILYLSLSLLQDGESILYEIFKEIEGGYRSLYRQKNLVEVLTWLETFRDGLCHYLNSHQKNYKNRLVTQVKKYIDNHISERLTLSDVASEFGITPNYLSLLFKKHSEAGFSEYITFQKIACAKTLMESGNLKVYEIADKLGFESAFYFSKVFKKVEGCSPRDYKQYQ